MTGRGRTTTSSWTAGVRLGLPVAAGLVVAGLAFGAYARSLGWGLLAPTVMSVLVFSTSAQVAAAGVLAAAGGPVAAIVAGTLANARFLPLGVAVASSLRGSRWRRAVESQAVVDAGFAAAQRRDGTVDRGILFGFFVTMVPPWVGGTAAGALLAGRLGDLNRYGLDAVAPALFLALLADDLRRPRRALVAVVAVVVVLATTGWLPVGIPPLLACAAALLGWRR
ncbi:MAG: AzlC family ABC transporter permease [Dermatophilaceae bacterium]